MAAQQSEQDDIKLRSLISILESCYVTLLELHDHGHLREPASGSISESDLNIGPSGPIGPWSHGLNQHVRYLAWKLLQEQARACYSAKYLLPEGMLNWGSLLLLCRGVFEHASKTSWILDFESDPRTRCIRTFLIELDSAKQDIGAAAIDSQDPDAKSKARANFNKMKDDGRGIFKSYQVSHNDSRNWSVEGVNYSSLRGLAGFWAKKFMQELDGKAIYDYLSTAAHPHGYAALSASVVRAGAIPRLPISELEKLVRLLVQFYNTSFHLYVRYHGESPDDFVTWESRIRTEFPGWIPA